MPNDQNFKVGVGYERVRDLHESSAGATGDGTFWPLLNAANEAMDQKHTRSSSGGVCCVKQRFDCYDQSVTLIDDA
jgi:hypothetical protein